MAAHRRVAGRQHEPHPVLHQLVTLHPLGQQAGLVLPFVSEDEVDVAERERGERLLRLQLEQLAPQSRARRGRALRMAGSASRSATDSKPAMRARPATVPAAAASSASATRRALEQRLGVAGEHQRRVGEAHTAPGALEQPARPTRAPGWRAAGTPPTA